MVSKAAETADFIKTVRLFREFNEPELLALDRDNLNGLIQVNPRAAAAFFHGLVQVFIERLRTSGELVAEITRWGLEATGLDMESR